MTLAVPLSAETEAKLAAKAQAIGMDIPIYAARVLEAAAIRPPLEEVLEPVRRNFAESGVSDHQFVEQFEAEKHAARVARRDRPLSE